MDPSYLSRIQEYIHIYSVQLTREYQIMKMVKALWLEKLTAKE